jgi:C-terminal processing protease CtpA/Prc
MTGVEAGSTSTLRLRGADGNVRDVTLPWTEAAHATPPNTTATPAAGASTKQTLLAKSSLAEEIVRAELSKMGARVPFFMTDNVKAQLGLTEVKPSQDALTKFGVTADAAAKVDYFAGTYTLDGKKVLLLRLPDYMPTDPTAALGYLEALFTEQQPNVDALVLDQTHNPGGNLFFAMGVAQLLAKQPFANVVQKNHADRLWVLGYANAADSVRAKQPDAAALLMSEAATVDQAYSAHKSLTDPMPIFDAPTTLDPDPAHWSKPLLVLVDELSVSCGDFLPALVKWNHMAPLFGQTTMGGGGNVEEVATLTNTRWTLNLSRGLGTVFDSTGAYPDERFVEDNGVKPDVTYSHTLADFRAGYVGYVQSFNSALAQQLAPPPAPPQP